MELGVSVHHVMMFVQAQKCKSHPPSHALVNIARTISSTNVFGIHVDRLDVRVSTPESTTGLRK